MSNPEMMAHVVWPSQFGDLEGKLLTIVDASFSDAQQRKAVKDLVRQRMWDWRQTTTMVESQGYESRIFEILEKQPREANLEI